MKRISLPLALIIISACLCSCATLATGLLSSSYKDAPVVLTYSEPEVIQDQSKIATLVVSKAYGVTIDRTPVKVFDGLFNPDLRISQSYNNEAYIIDLLPGTHVLEVTYDVNASAGQATTSSSIYKSGSTSITASLSAPPIPIIRTSETTHDLKAGAVYAIGLELFTISGRIDLYAMDESDRAVVIQTRNNAKFEEE